jgi:hypothetical protein
MSTRVNQSGSPLGPNGYVLCRDCHQEVADISRETAPGWAYHIHHRPNQGGQEHGKA